MKLFMAGQSVPEWLQKVCRDDYSKPYKKPVLKFETVSVVYVKQQHYIMRPLIGQKGGDVVFSINNGTNCVIRGQSPHGSGKPVLINATPIFTYGEVTLIALLAVFISLWAN